MRPGCLPKANRYTTFTYFTDLTPVSGEPLLVHQLRPRSSARWFIILPIMKRTGTGGIALSKVCTTAVSSAPALTSGVLYVRTSLLTVEQYYITRYSVYSTQILLGGGFSPSKKNLQSLPKTAHKLCALNLFSAATTNYRYITDGQ